MKIGIIGCGGIATGKHLPALAEIENIEILAFCDLKEDLAREVKEQYGTKESKVFTNYQEMLNVTDLDIVYVLTPNDTHAEISIAAMEAGSHVMCEKPMAKTAAEARTMVEAADRTGKKLTIGYQNRFRPDSQYLKQISANGDLGEIYNAKAHAIRRRAVPTWGVFLDEEAQGGGPLIDIGTHALDLTLWMMDNYKPKYVMGNAYYKLSQTENAANAWGPWDTEKFTVEDSAFGFIVMENGATIYLESSWALNSRDEGEAKTTLHGTKAGADMQDGLTINGEEHGVLYDKKIITEVGGVDFYEGSSDEPGLIEAQAWISAIENNTDPIVKPEEALVVTEILETIYESAQTGEPVYLNKD